MEKISKIDAIETVFASESYYIAHKKVNVICLISKDLNGRRVEKKLIFPIFTLVCPICMF